MKIKSIMTSDVVTVGMDDSLKRIKEIFERKKFHHLLIVGSGKICGIVSDRDFLKAISPTIGTAAETTKDSATLNKRAHQIMSRHPITLPSSANVYDAIELFNQHDISCIPITNAELKPIGIISWRDILKQLSLKHRSHQ